MKLDLQRTIVAVGSAVLPAPRVVIRLSGELTIDLLQKVLRESPEFPPVAESLAQRSRASFFRAKLELNSPQHCIDVSVYLWPNERSFTGEPCAELHMIGSMPLVQMVQQRLIMEGASPAERGEFALRSFLAGKMDLVQAEAVLGVIESTNLDQLQWSLAQLAGNISLPVRRIREQLVDALAHLEAGLDFVEEDIEFISREQLTEMLRSIKLRLVDLQQQLDSRGTVSREIEVGLVGLPNAGKSSLFNALLGLDRTIVSSQAGTTRDVVSAQLELGGLTLSLLDTAGLESIQDRSPRALAQEMARDRLATCDVILHCIDLSDTAQLDSSRSSILDLEHRNRQIVLTVGTKLDLVERVSSGSVVHAAPPEMATDFNVSIHCSDSISGLREMILAAVERRSASQFTQATHQTAVRCLATLRLASGSLEIALNLIDDDQGEELIAAELHECLYQLASIIGQVHNDDILGQIFSKFCIGK